MAGILVAVLVATNVISVVLFFRARSLNRQFSQNTDQLKNWLRVQADLERASGALLEIRRVDSNAIFYREPTA